MVTKEALLSKPPGRHEYYTQATVPLGIKSEDVTYILDIFCNHAARERSELAKTKNAAFIIGAMKAWGHRGETICMN